MSSINPNDETRPTRINAPIHQPILKVLGLGGGGGNAVDRMIELGIEGVDFIVANTDHQVLKRSNAPTKIQLGPKATRGLGAGGNPSIGKAAAEESWREIATALAGADMVFLTAGMGGGTGTGSIPIATQIAKKCGAVAIAVVTTPFSFEMGRRQQNATDGLEELRKHTNTLISIPNDRLLDIAPKDLPLDTAFRLADDVLRQAVQSITELITESGLINVDFSHVRRLMKLGGGALMTIGQAQGTDKALEAVKQALHHPLLDNIIGEDELTYGICLDLANIVSKAAGLVQRIVIAVPEIQSVKVHGPVPYTDASVIKQGTTELNVLSLHSCCRIDT